MKKTIETILQNGGNAIIRNAQLSKQFSEGQKEITMCFSARF